MSAYSVTNVATLCLTICFTLGGIFSWYKVLPNHLRDLGASDADLGLAAMLITFAYRGPQVVGGWMADRLSRRAIVAVGTLAMAPLYAAASMARTWPACLACLCGVWVVGALQWPALLSLLTESSKPDRRGRAIGWLDFSSILGQTIGPLWGAAVLASPRGDVRHLFLITAAIYVVMGAVRLLMLRNVSSREIEAEPAHGAARWPVVAVAMMMAMAGFVAFYLTWDGPFPSMYLADVYKLSKSAINVNAVIGGVLTMGAAIVCGALVDRVGPVKFVATAFVLMAATAVPFLQNTFPPASKTFPYGVGYVLVALASMPIEGYFLAYQRIITSIGPARHRSLFVGLFGSAVGLISGSVNFLAGALYARHGYRAPMALATLGCAVGFVMALVLVSMLRRAPNAVPVPEVV